MTKNKQSRCERALERLRIRLAKLRNNNDGTQDVQLAVTEREITILESKLGTERKF